MNLIILLLLQVSISFAQGDDEATRRKSLFESLDQPDEDEILEKKLGKEYCPDKSINGKIYKAKVTGHRSSTVKTQINNDVVVSSGESLTCQYVLPGEDGKLKVVEIDVDIPQKPLNNDKQLPVGSKESSTQNNQNKSEKLSVATPEEVINKKETQVSEIKSKLPGPLSVNELVPATLKINNPLILQTTLPTGEKKLVVAEPDLDCEKELNKLILDLLKDKNKNIIAHQFEVTAMKIARESVKNNRKTFEGLIENKKMEMEKLEGKSEVLDKLKATYKKFGMIEDIQDITKQIEKQSSLSYYDKKRRLTNQTGSAMILAYHAKFPKSDLDMNDVAVVWLMNKVSDQTSKKFNQFSTESNRTNISNRVAFYTGAVDIKNAKSATDLDAMIEKEKTLLNDEFVKVSMAFKEKNLACYNKIFADECTNPTLVENKIVQLFATDVAQIQSKLDINPDLKIQLDNTYIDLGELGMGK